MQYSYKPPRQRRKRSFHKLIGYLIVILLVSGGAYAVVHAIGTPKAHPAKTTVATIDNNANQQPTTNIKAKTTTPTPSPCAANNLAKLALVSISQRHMWACQGQSVVYDSAVVTGMENLPADLTPTGTYHIYAKTTNLYLNGHDSTGSWHDYVNYWMPFLDNKYGAYGFHDATWRPANAFGNISPYSSNASHGCVEMPLAAAKWLYTWAAIGTTVTIES